MRVWSNTKTLDGFIPEIEIISNKALAEVALIGGHRIDLDEFPRLRGIFKTGVGRDNVPENEASKRGIICGFPSTETGEIIFEETSSFACHLILTCLYSDTGDFASWTKLPRTVLRRQNLLVVGTGNIGRRVASQMRPFIEVSTFDRLTHRFDELEPLMRQADCISLHLPLTDETLGFFDAVKLGWMKDGSALVNTARGGLVVEADLFNEIESGRLRAAFDVFWKEPYSGRMLELPPSRFLTSPHVGSTCREFVEDTARDFLAFLSKLENV